MMGIVCSECGNPHIQVEANYEIETDALDTIVFRCSECGQSEFVKVDKVLDESRTVWEFKETEVKDL